jgi:xanthine dehydrogenase accessory factor
MKELTIAIKGAGEMATGIACRLFQANCKKIFMMETPNPMAVRRKVSFCEAVYDESAVVENVTAIKIANIDNSQTIWSNNCIPVVVDPGWNAVKAIRPDVVIDAIIAKRNLGTKKTDAPLVIGLGPGFEAGNDVHIVIETNRGHNLGRVISKGRSEINTGIPGNIGGYTKERVLRAPCAGKFESSLNIGNIVKKNDVVGHVGDCPVIAQINGVLRGLIRNKTKVTDHLKIGDIDPRENVEYCTTISEKSRAIGGSVLEAILKKYNH